MPSLSENTLAIKTEPNGEKSLSLYSGELSPEVVAENVAKIKATFPALPFGFFDIFMERVKSKGFTNERLIDAVNNVIDNCKYPTPMLADFLSFDKRVKFITYAELCDKVSTIGEKFDSYARIKVSGKSFFIKKSDIEVHNIPDEI